MCPFFINKRVLQEAVPQHMMDYLQNTGRTRGNGRKLMGALSAEKMLIYAPLLRCYVTHGAVIKAAHCTIDYQQGRIFTWFVEQVTEACRTGHFVFYSHFKMAAIYRDRLVSSKHG